MTRRKQLLALTLILLPSLLAIATLSGRSFGNKQPPATSAQTPVGIVPYKVMKGSAAIVAPPSFDTSQATRLANAAIEDVEHQPPSPITAIADSYTAPSPQFDSFATTAEESEHVHSNFAHDYAELGGGLWRDFGGGVAGVATGYAAHYPTTNTSSNNNQSISRTTTHDPGSSQHTGSPPNNDNGLPNSDSHGNDNQTVSDSDQPSSAPGSTLPNEEEQPVRVSVPEPSTLSLIGISLFGMMLSRKRRA